MESSLKGKLSGSLVERASLAPAIVGQLYAIFERHYAHTSRAAFDHDLAEKDWVILLSDSESAEIRGFSTLLLMTVELDRKRIHAIFSGDTIIDRDYWGEQELVKIWCQFMGTLLHRYPADPLYWFLLSKGYRTYLFLPIYFNKFYPCHDQPTPEFEGRLLSHLANLKYPGHYRQDSGVIEFSTSHGNLKDDLLDIKPNRLKDPNVQFFLKCNPRYASGSELVCLAEITEGNMKGLARRMLLKGYEDEAQNGAGNAVKAGSGK